MNTSKRLIFGILSSILLAVGFAKAADRLDPMTGSIQHSVGIPLQEGGDPDRPDGAPNCEFPGDEN